MGNLIAHNPFAPDGVALDWRSVWSLTMAIDGRVPHIARPAPFLVACVYNFERVIESMLSRPCTCAKNEHFHCWKVRSLTMPRSESDGYVRGMNGLHLAAQHGHVAAVRLLLQAGFQVDEETESGETVYSLASSSGNVEVIKLVDAHRSA
jgi:hypothetical protein